MAGIIYFGGGGGGGGGGRRDFGIEEVEIHCVKH